MISDVEHFFMCWSVIHIIFLGEMSIHILCVGGHGNALQYSCLENPHGQRSLEGYSTWDLKALKMTKQLNNNKKL